MFVDRLIPQAAERLIAIGQDTPVAEAARLLRNSPSDMLIVCDHDGHLAGVITKSDIVAQIGHCQGASCTAGVSSVMSRQVTVCGRQDRLQDVWAVMKERQLKNVPVTDDEAHPIGILNARDALQAMVQEVEQEETLLRDYVMCIGYR